MTSVKCSYVEMCSILVGNLLTWNQAARYAVENIGALKIQKAWCDEKSQITFFGIGCTVVNF